MITYINNQLKKREGKFHLKSEAFADAIISAIKENEIKVGDPLPSINEIIKELNLSRKTIYTGYSILREQGIIGARERIGYYISSENVKKRLHILFVVNSLSPYLRDLFDALRARLESFAKIELSTHGANPKTFTSLLKDNIEQYDKILISGFNHSSFKKELEKIPSEKLILFSRDGGFKKAENYFLQDFLEGTYNALLQVSDTLTKYKNFYLIYDKKDKNFPIEIAQATEKISTHLGLKFFHLNNLSDTIDFRKSLFLLIDDNDLVAILEKIEKKKLVLGQDAGIISYNETAIKRVIRQGISTISIDFKKMGEMIADSILNAENKQIKMETKFIKRPSF